MAYGESLGKKFKKAKQEGMEIGVEIGKKLQQSIKEFVERQEEILITYGQLIGEEFKKGGIEIGRLKGMIQGREEAKEEIAKNMLLKLKLDIDTVQKATELPKANLEKILQESR